MGYGMLTENGRALGLTHEDSMHFIMTTSDGKIARVSGCYSAPPQPHMRDSHMTCVLRGTKGASRARTMVASIHGLGSLKILTGASP